MQLQAHSENGNQEIFCLSCYKSYERGNRRTARQQDKLWRYIGKGSKSCLEGAALHPAVYLV